IAHQWRKIALLGERGDGFRLVLAAHHGAADEAAQIGAPAQHGAERLQLPRHRVERLAVIGEIEEGRGVAVGQSAYAFPFGGHVRTVLVSPGREWGSPWDA